MLFVSELGFRSSYLRLQMFIFNGFLCNPLLCGPLQPSVCLPQQSQDIGVCWNIITVQFNFDRSPGKNTKNVTPVVIQKIFFCQWPHFESARCSDLQLQLGNFWISFFFKKRCGQGLSNSYPLWRPDFTLAPNITKVIKIPAPT